LLAIQKWTKLFLVRRMDEKRKNGNWKMENTKYTKSI